MDCGKNRFAGGQERGERLARGALRLAPEIGIITQTTTYPLNLANQALADLRAGCFEGAAVLVP